MARKPAKEQGDTLERIRAEAFGMFGRYGYDGVSMLHVAKAAGITKAALYWHFDSKEALFLDCQKQLHQIFNQHVMQRMASHDKVGEQLKHMFYGVVHLLRDERIRNGVAGYWLGSSSLNTSAAIDAHKKFEGGSISALRKIMQRAIDEELMVTDIPADDMARAALAVWEGIVVPLRVESPDSIERLMITLARTYFRAHGAHALANSISREEISAV